jgi:hypothetical protein
LSRGSSGEFGHDKNSFMKIQIGILAALLSAGSLKAGDWEQQQQRQWDRLWEQGQRDYNESAREWDVFQERMERQREQDERRVRDMQEDYNCDY